MDKTLLGIIASILAIIIGWWKYRNSQKEYLRGLADEAQKKLKESQESFNSSAAIDAWGMVNRL